jgi:hypothetical protein
MFLQVPRNQLFNCVQVRFLHCSCIDITCVAELDAKGLRPEVVAVDNNEEGTGTHNFLVKTQLQVSSIPGSRYAVAT